MGLGSFFRAPFLFGSKVFVLLLILLLTVKNNLQNSALICYCIISAQFIENPTKQGVSIVA